MINPLKSLVCICVVVLVLETEAHHLKPETEIPIYKLIRNTFKRQNAISRDLPTAMIQVLPTTAPKSRNQVFEKPAGEFQKRILKEKLNLDQILREIEDENNPEEYFGQNTNQFY